VPKELGGLGLSLPNLCQEQHRLADHAQATAVAVNMPLYWTALAADLWRAGDTSHEWRLRGTIDGDVFAAEHAETGNDMLVLLSTTKAERAEGRYRFTGRKSFGSLTPVWTYLGLHGMDTREQLAPKIVHVFVPRAVMTSS
jgi:alkylation response protein AidB-like acyl-CoA dehydrogenase